MIVSCISIQPLYLINPKITAGANYLFESLQNKCNTFHLYVISGLTLKKLSSPTYLRSFKGEPKRSDHFDANLSLDTLQNRHDASFSDLRNIKQIILRFKVEILFFVTLSHNVIPRSQPPFCTVCGLHHGTI